jgi:hypothetical protein
MGRQQRRDSTRIGAESLLRFAMLERSVVAL